jgi:short-subunit dehydrogenase
MTATPRTALITGASSGIGEAFARRLAAQGYDLVLVARRAERLAALAAQLQAAHPIHAESLVADLSDASAIGRVEACIQEMASLMILVHAAGFGTLGRFASKPVDRQAEMVEVHDVAALRLTRAALPGMLARRQGAIILVSSVAAFTAGPGSVTYSATKAFLNTFCEGLQSELAGTGVRVQALCPGLTRTEFHDAPEFADFKRRSLPWFFWMSADDVARQSLRALRSGPVVFVPGWHDKVAVALAQCRPIRTLWQKAARRLPGRMQ